VIANPAPIRAQAPRIAAQPGLTPYLKWPGGKTRELPAIAAAAPDLAGRFIDPFVGGGSVLLATPAAVPAVVNDACEDLVGLYSAAASGDREFRRAADGLAHAWDGLTEGRGLFDDLAGRFLRGDAGDTVDAARAAGAGSWLGRHRADIASLLEPAGPDMAETFFARAARDLPAKFERMRRVESAVARRLTRPDLLANVEGAVRSAFYMSVRARYNSARLAGSRDGGRLADFLFLREFAYASMFRFNSKGAFNVPYGGITYNGKSFGTKVALLYGEAMQARLANTRFACADFESFLTGVDLRPDDFLFIDPPYDSDFSDYDNMAFGASDQVRLRDLLEGVSCRVMVVIKDTPTIRQLYGSDRWHTVGSPKTYMWTIKSRNDRLTTHLMITNYRPAPQAE
jgi:DNA adenine methylase